MIRSANLTLIDKPAMDAAVESYNYAVSVVLSLIAERDGALKLLTERIGEQFAEVDRFAKLIRSIRKGESQPCPSMSASSA
jgi:hypothetical protein